MYWVYILYSESRDRYYIEQTGNINQRLSYHNAGRSTYTKSGIPWELKWTHKCSSRSQAKKLESWIKKMKSRDFTKRIIEGKIDIEL